MMNIERIFGLPSARRSGVLLLVAAVLAVVYVVAPAGGIVDSIRVAAPIIAAGAVLFGIVIHQPERATSWFLVAVSFVALAAAHVTWTVLQARGDVTFPSLADGFHALFWCLVLLAMSIQIRDSLAEHDSFGSFEVALVTTAVGVGIWLVVVEPYLSDSNLGFAATMWAGAVPLVGGLAFAASVRIAANGAFREFSPLAMMVGLALILLGDIVRGALELRGDFVSGSIVAAAGVLGPLIIAAGALDPTMATRNRRSAPTSLLGVARTIGLSVAVLTPITVLLALLASDLGTTTTKVVIAGAALGVGHSGSRPDVGAGRRRARTHRTSRSGPPRSDGRTLE